jgi:hypothetical protein
VNRSLEKRRAALLEAKLRFRPNCEFFTAVKRRIPKSEDSLAGELNSNCLHEAFGLVEYERDVTRRFANAGFMAIAPDVYSRVGALKNAGDMNEVLAKMFSLKRHAAGR